MILFALLISLSHAASDDAQMRKECFEQNKGRSCVRLGTTLWQDKTTRSDARKAFEKGCELKQESACELKEMKSKDQEVTVAPAPAKTNTPDLVTPTPKTAIIPKGIKSKGLNQFSIERSAALAYAQDLPNVLEQAAIQEQKLENGTIQGYRFMEIDKPGVFDSLGFQKEDVVTHVNGRAVNSASQATAMLPSLAYQKKYEIKVIRDGKTVVNKYDVVD